MTSIIVIDLGPLAYDAASLLHSPLGGTESAVIETCLSLSQQMDVVLFNAISSPCTYGRLHIRPHASMLRSELAQAKWVVFVSWVPEPVLAQLPKSTHGPKYALWAHHDIDQHAVQFLANSHHANVFSKYVFVSAWQRNRYVMQFGIAPESTVVIGNPYCARAMDTMDLSGKRFDYPRLIYTSTPFRGLDILVDAFPIFRQRFPDAELAVLSGMELYGSRDNTPYLHLYTKIERTPGISLIKPTGKLALYRQLQEANLFVYPSTFAETFCIAALEAQLAGNPLLLTRLGALPEIFEGAHFLDIAPSTPLTPEGWADFMARTWRAISAKRARLEAIAQQKNCQRQHSPQAVAERFLAGLLD